MVRNNLQDRQAVTGAKNFVSPDDNCHHIFSPLITTLFAKLANERNSALAIADVVKLNID